MEVKDNIILISETKRWIGKLRALYNRHEKLVSEIKHRSYQHHSPLNKKLAKGKAAQDILINTILEQKEILKNKECKCPISKQP